VIALFVFAIIKSSFFMFYKIAFGKRTLDPDIRRKCVALKILTIFIEVKRILIRQEEERYDIEKYDG